MCASLFPHPLLVRKGHHIESIEGVLEWVREDDAREPAKEQLYRHGVEHRYYRKELGGKNINRRRDCNVNAVDRCWPRLARRQSGGDGEGSTRRWRVIYRGILIAFLWRVSSSRRFRESNNELLHVIIMIDPHFNYTIYYI